MCGAALQCSLCCQAAAAYQIYNWYVGHCLGGKEVLAINLDETCVRCYESHSKGNVFGSANVVQRVPKQSRKKCLTYIAIISSRREYQHLLPQYIVGNESTFLKKDVDALSHVLKGNTVLVRCAWRGIVCLLQFARFS